MMTRDPRWRTKTQDGGCFMKFQILKSRYFNVIERKEKTPSPLGGLIEVFRKYFATLSATKAGSNIARGETPFSRVINAEKTPAATDCLPVVPQQKCGYIPTYTWSARARKQVRAC